MILHGQNHGDSLQQYPMYPIAVSSILGQRLHFSMDILMDIDGYVHGSLWITLDRFGSLCTCPLRGIKKQKTTWKTGEGLAWHPRFHR